MLANELSEYVAKFKYLGSTVTNKNCNYEKIKSRFNMGMCPTILVRVFLLKTVKIKIYRTRILPVILYGCAI